MTHLSGGCRAAAVRSRLEDGPVRQLGEGGYHDVQVGQREAAVRIQRLDLRPCPHPRLRAAADALRERCELPHRVQRPVRRASHRLVALLKGGYQPQRLEHVSLCRIPGVPCTTASGQACCTGRHQEQAAGVAVLCMPHLRYARGACVGLTCLDVFGLEAGRQRRHTGEGAACSGAQCMRSCWLPPLRRLRGRPCSSNVRRVVPARTGCLLPRRADATQRQSCQHSGGIRVTLGAAHTVAHLRTPGWR